MKKILALLLATSTAVALSGCGKDDYEGIDKDASGTLDLLMWNGDGLQHKDIGKKNWTRDDINGQTVADVYAVAKKFNEIYPNISINLKTKAYGPDDIDPSTGVATQWEQELDTFKDLNGKYPDLWVSNNVTRDMSKGLVQDLSHFENDPVYQTYNPTLLSLTNFYGFQAGLPQYAIPQGIFINKELAEHYGVTAAKMPTPQWTWSEYTDFVSRGDVDKGVFGSWDASMSIIKSTLVESQLQSGSVNGAYIDVNTDAFKTAIEDLPKQATTALQSQYGLGFVPESFMEEHGNYVTNFFADNTLLTLYDYMAASELGNMTIPGMRTEVTSQNWDYYPIPSMDPEVGNTVNILYDPMVMYNYAGTDGKLSASEEAQAKIAYEFMSFYTASTEAWEARAAQEFSAGLINGEKIYKAALSDSLPLIKAGDEFDKQMAIWYSTDNHKAFNAEDDWGNVAFPGFQYTVELWGQGKISGVSGKAYPLDYLDASGTSIDCFYYLNGFGMPDINGGNTLTDEAWYSAYVAGLFEANEIMNERFTAAFDGVKNSLKNNYGFKDADLK